MNDEQFNKEILQKLLTTGIGFTVIYPNKTHSLVPIYIEANKGRLFFFEFKGCTGSEHYIDFDSIIKTALNTYVVYYRKRVVAIVEDLEIWDQSTNKNYYEKYLRYSRENQVDPNNRFYRDFIDGYKPWLINKKNIIFP